MPGRPRIHLAGISLHLVQRGHNRDACFFAEDDYVDYRHWLDEALMLTRCGLHAYALVSNPVHLLLTPPDPRDVPRLMISLGRRCVQYSNRTHRRTGALRDSRNPSSRVQEETYLAVRHRHIELDSVRANRVGNPESYRRSRYRSNALGEPDALPTPPSASPGARDP